ncbi:glycosyltransferase family 22 protein [Mycena alexandri]|uniref:Mannosyltransferase n=1 Tax=Mycena alexandri TaxID=1745969 RepID=A0AAD6STH2_9AGAR|nr:glycosyltransferase family 22 protein [Mycena alexandri]
MSLALDGLILVTGWTHVLLAPYTKVEESFNLHAVHDVLMYGVAPSSLPHYDHFVFSGAVPRTFIGSVLLAWISQPVIYVAHSLGLVGSKFELQIIVRLVLATINALGLCLLRHAVSRRFGRPTGLYYTLLTCSQFHVPFWMGRTLPNMLALLPVNLSAYLIIDRAPNTLRPSQKSVGAAISLLVFSAVVFRAEIAALAGALALQSIVLGHTSFWRVFKVCAVSGVASIALTVGVDSYFWAQPYLWPEWQSIYFNVVEGKSAEWGIHPAHAYLTTHLPKLLLSSLPLALPALLPLPFLSSSPLSRGRRRLVELILPSAVLVAAMSAVGHKEWRFVVYVVPVWNVVAARGVGVLLSHPKSTLLGRLLFLAASALLLTNIGATVLLTAAAVRNYPGGEAMAVLNTKARDNGAPVHAHLTNLALQSGASLFTHVHAPPYPVLSLLPPVFPPSPSLTFAASLAPNWVYDKTDSPTSFANYTHVIAESRTPSPSPSSADAGMFGFMRKKKEDASAWTELGSIRAFERWRVDRDVLRRREVLDTETGETGVEMGMIERLSGMLTLEERERLWVLERAGRGSAGSAKGSD